MIQLFSILSQYFQDTVYNSIEPCTLCKALKLHKYELDDDDWAIHNDLA